MHFFNFESYLEENNYDYFVNSNNIKQALEHSELYKQYYERVNAEATLCGIINNENRILFLGSGSIPYAPIILAQKFNCRIHGIERDISTVNRSRKLIKALGLEKKITIEWCDAENYNPQGYNIIFIALVVEPRNEIIKTMYSKSDEGATILYRVPSGIYRLLYNGVDDIDLNFFKKSHMQLIDANEKCNYRSICIRK